jgi:spartin
MSTNTEVEEILTLKSVDVYHICYNRNDGNYDLVSVIKDSSLRIFRELIVGNDKQKELAQRLALIKCKDWFYPLENGKTFVYRSRDKSLCYLFPDPSIPDSLSIVVINTDVVDDIKVILFENVLLLYCSLQDSPQEWKIIIDQLTQAVPEAVPEPVPEAIPTVPTETPISEPQPERHESGTAQMLAQNIVYGAEVINSGITYGTQVAKDLVKRGAAHIKSIHSNEDHHNLNVDPRVISGLRNLRGASHKACAVTGYAVNAVAKGTHQVSKCLAPHVRRHSTKLISSVSGKDESNSGQICDNIFTVASGGLQGFATLYNGVTENAISFAKTISNETVGIVNKRYGNDAGVATEEALYTAGNTAMAAHNVQQLGPKAIAKKAAFDTGKTVINDKTQEDTQRKA